MEKQNHIWMMLWMLGGARTIGYGLTYDNEYTRSLLHCLVSESACGRFFWRPFTLAVAPFVLRGVSPASTSPTPALVVVLPSPCVCSIRLHDHDPSVALCSNRPWKWWDASGQQQIPMPSMMPSILAFDTTSVNGRGNNHALCLHDTSMHVGWNSWHGAFTVMHQRPIQHGVAI